MADKQDIMTLAAILETLVECDRDARGISETVLFLPFADRPDYFNRLMAAAIHGGLIERVKSYLPGCVRATAKGRGLIAEVWRQTGRCPETGMAMDVAPRG